MLCLRRGICFVQCSFAAVVAVCDGVDTVWVGAVEDAAVCV